MTTPAPTGTSRVDAAEVAVLQRVLEGERAAVYGYGVVGGQASSSDRPRALAAMARHAARRDEVEQAFRAAGATPVAEAAAYALPFAVLGPSAARRLAVHLERGLAGCYADAVAAVVAARRADAAAQLTEATLAARSWGAAPVPFPGLAERA